MKFFSLIFILNLNFKFSSPIEGCEYPLWHADGMCDDMNNMEACFYDGGDCCGSDANKDYCAICICHQSTLCQQPNWYKDGYCDDQNNIETCFYDGGDCCGPNVNTDYCTNCFCLE